MPRTIPSGDKVRVTIDMSEIVNFLANGEVMVKKVQTKKYQNNLWDTAFADADNNFNVSAAAYATATGSISHMYEWGTQGINKRASDMRPNPMSEQARLWKSSSMGNGFDRILTYAFKPSFGVVPKPTVKATGMSSQVISKMREHIFRWKAEMMEWGRLVELPKRDKFYLIPVTKENEQYARPNDRKRGYMMTKGPISFYAGGHKYANNFTSFFVGYWNGEGAKVMNDSINNQFFNDFVPNFSKSTRTSKMMTPGFPIKAEIEKRAKMISKEVDRQASIRAKGGTE